jgi:hypothetical protein
MTMGGSSPPPPTPPRETSAAQTGANISTAIANNFMQNANLIGADGSTQTTNQTGTYRFTDPYTRQTYDIPTFTRTEALSPIRQQTLTQNNQANLNLATLGANTSQQLIGNMQNQLTAEDLGPRPELGQLRTSYDTDFTADRARTEEALFSRLNPKLQQDRAALETQLSNQGIKLGSAAFDRAMSNFGQQSNDARMTAILASGQEQSRLADLARQSASFGNAAMMDQYNAGLSGRAQTMQEAFALDNQPINKAMALASGTQVAMPQFQAFNSARIPTTDNAGIIQNYDQQQFQRWQAEEQSNNQLMGGLMGGISSMGAAWLRSDERLKEDIEPVGTLKGHKLYEYTMKDTGEKQIGVMAQEVRKKRPDAVKKDPESGYLKVNYGALFNAGKKGAR